MIVFVSHEECETRFAEAMESVHKLMDQLKEVKADRDEWKTQHENLLAMYRAQGDELARCKATTDSSRKDRRFRVKWFQKLFARKRRRETGTETARTAA
jgi:hypothetical protein